MQVVLQKELEWAILYYQTKETMTNIVTRNKEGYLIMMKRPIRKT
jgi:hypothetical protein